MEFETRAIHAGQEPDPTTGALTVPIHQTSTYLQDAVGENKGYDYSRAANPTRSALEACLASLEEAEHGVAFASGLAAATTVQQLQQLEWLAEADWGPGVPTTIDLARPRPPEP